MSFSEYNGNKTKVSQTVGKIFKNAQDSFPKIQTSQAIGSILKSISSSNGHNSGSSDHERLNKSTLSPPGQVLSKFGFQKFRLKSGAEKRRSSSNHHAELLDNQEVEDPDDSTDETEFEPHNNYLPVCHATLTGKQKSSSVPGSPIKQKRWPF